MFAKRNPQKELFGSHNLLADWVGPKTFYVFMANEGRTLFDDEFFKEWYSDDNGRPCVPPSTLAIATVLQMYDRCSDEEVVERTKFDDRWKVALDLGVKEKPFAKSTFQEFRTNILLNEAGEELFLRRSLKLARKFGLLAPNANTGGMKVALDTTPITGRGAVKDTFNLVGDGIRLLVRAFSKATQTPIDEILKLLELDRYFAKRSLKGGAGIDWSDAKERRAFLNTLAADALRLLDATNIAKKTLAEDSRKEIESKESLLRSLLTQDTELDPEDPEKKRLRIKVGTAKDRIPSAHDPEARHGRKSSSKRFTGHKLSTSTDTKSGLIVGVEVLSGNAPDNEGALKLVESSEKNTGLDVDKSTGDCAYGDGRTRQEFVDAGREHVAKVPAPPSNQPFHKTHFKIDLETSTVTCPAGQTTCEFELAKTPTGEHVKKFFFPLAVCQACAHRDACIQSKSALARRSVTLHPQEKLLQEARAYQQTEEFGEDIRDRQAAEHSFARVIQYGARQARYFGKAKVKIQGIMAATLINLMLVLSFSQSNPATATETAPESSPLPGQECVQADDSPRPPGEATLEPGRAELPERPPDGTRGAPPGPAATASRRLP
jgi:hypothetical protein